MTPKKVERIGLVDVDGKNFPNLVLMKISAWHKAKGDRVEWYEPMFSGHFDKVYLSKVFSFTPDFDYPIDADEVERGGTGYCISLVNGKEVFDKMKNKSLPYEVEHIYPDYSLYPELTKDTAYGFLNEAIMEEAVTQVDPRIGKRIEYDGKRDGEKGKGQRAFVALRYGNGTKQERTQDKGSNMVLKDGVVVRNKRDVWTVNVKPTKEAHFATYPEKLIIPCILAGCPEGGVVLDPFMGSGTTGIVARKLNRQFVGIEINPDYQRMAERRIFNEGENLFTTIKSNYVDD